MTREHVCGGLWFASACATTAAASQWTDSSRLLPTKINQHPPTCGNYSHSNQQRADCREHAATMTRLGKGISFHLSPIHAVRKSLMRRRWGFLMSLYLLCAPSDQSLLRLLELIHKDVYCWDWVKDADTNMVWDDDDECGIHFISFRDICF